MENRRKYLRFNSNIKANLGFWGSLKPKKTICIIRDVSREGFRISTRDQLDKNEKYEIELKLPDENTPVFCVGKTVWTKPVNEKIYETGLELAVIKPHDRNRLLDYLSEEWIRARKPRYNLAY